MTPPGVGVDVVDLRNPRTRGRQHDARFLNRIFDETERALVMSAPDPERAVWLHWAAKEAAFKAVGSAVHPELPPVFDHSAFAVTDVGAEGATVRWSGHRIHVALRSDPEGWWVGALGQLDGIDPAVRWAVADSEDTAIRLGTHDETALHSRLGPAEREASRGFTHALVRLAARTELGARMKVSIDRLEIVSPSGPPGRVPPLVYLDGAPTERARVSLSHDGPRIAWATWVETSSRRAGS